MTTDQQTCKMNKNRTVSIENFVFYDYKNMSVILQRLFDYTENNNASSSVLENINNKLQEMLALAENPGFNDVVLNNWVQKLQHNLKVYIPPFLLLLGIIGNILTIIILRYRRTKRNTVNVYLSVLAMADTGVLIFGLLSTWIYEVSGVDVFRSVDVLCRTWNFLAYVFSMFSVWLIVIITAERFIVVCRPLLAQQLCNQKKAHLLIMCFLSFSISFNGHLLLTTGIVDMNGVTQCDALERYRHFLTNVWPCMDAIVNYVLPLFVISLLNAVIIIKVATASRRRRSMQSTRFEGNSNSHKNVKLTIMLLTVSVTFCISTSPMAILMMTGVLFKENATPSRLTTLLLARTICELLMYLNHSINFILYCLSGRNFTTALKEMFCRSAYNSRTSFRKNSNMIVTLRETSC